MKYIDLMVVLSIFVVALLFAVYLSNNDVEDNSVEFEYSSSCDGSENQSCSMCPTICTHDKYKTVKVSNSTFLKVGDIVVYDLSFCDKFNKSGRANHRIIMEPFDDVFVLKGDNNKFADACLVKREFVVEKVVEIYPR